MSFGYLESERLVWENKVKYFGELELQTETRMENVGNIPGLLTLFLTQVVSGTKKVNSAPALRKRMIINLY